MPNWCVTNWKVIGKTEDIQQFCDTVNDLPKHPVDKDNFFGNYWLGNLGKQLGVELDPNKDNYRGTIDVDSGLCASLIFPGTSGEDKQPLLDKQSCGKDLSLVEFSTASAWDRPFWLEDYLKSHFVDYGFSSTDEFGNFHIVHNTDLFPWVYEVHAEDEWEEFKVGEEEKVAEMIARLLDIELGPPANYEELMSAIEPYLDEMDEKEIEFIAYEIE